MIGAAAELAAATGDASYLARRRRHRGLACSPPRRRPDTCSPTATNASCTGDCQQFKGIVVSLYLQELCARFEPSRADYAAVLAPRSAASIWGNARAPSGLFATDWAGPPTRDEHDQRGQLGDDGGQPRYAQALRRVPARRARR